jgi:hypothetical protein
VDTEQDDMRYWRRTNQPASTGKTTFVVAVCEGGLSVSMEIEGDFAIQAKSEEGVSFPF